MVEGELDIGAVTDRSTLTDLSAMVRNAFGCRLRIHHRVILADADHGSECVKYQRRGHQCHD